MSLMFSNKRLEIPEDKKIILWRFLDDGKSPFIGNHGDEEGFNPVKWDLTAQSVKDDGVGIFGINEEQVHLYNNSYLNHCVIMYPKPIFLRLEADIRNIVGVNFSEVVVSECNILEVFNQARFIRTFALYSQSSEWLYRRIGGGAPFLKELFTLMKEMTKNQMHSILNVGDPYGYHHSMRVDVNIQMLGKRLWLNTDDVNAISHLYAHWHDILRFNNGNDPEHGKRAADVISRNRKHPSLNPFCEIGTIRNTPLSDDLTDRLIYACEHHTTMHKSGDPLIDICFDGDRMDLTRVGIKPDPKQMATEAGVYYATNYNEYLNEFQNFDYQSVRQ